MPPLMSRRASGTETMPMIETCRATRRKLSTLRNRSLCVAKNKMSRASASESALSTSKRILRKLAPDPLWCAMVSSAWSSMASPNEFADGTALV